MVINALRVAPSAEFHSRFLVPLMAVIVYLFVALPAGAADRPASFADQVEALSPAVVNISTTTIVSDGAGVDMIINSTSLGLHADDALPLALDQVGKDTVIADIIMVPAETKWLQDAAGRGLAVHYGRHMLDYQIDLIGRFIGAF